MSTPELRRAELRDNLAVVRSRLDAACVSAGRRPHEVTLIAVTKFFPAADAVMLAELGVTDLGESRDQEAAAKVAEFAALTNVSPRWHFIGRLQTNKARSVARYADLVHSVDRIDLVGALADGARKARRERLDVLAQVSLDADPARGGTTTADLLRLADTIAEQDVLRLAGVMAIAPIDSDPDQAYALLAECADAVRAAHPDAVVISAGMSDDLEAAIRHGATHVRIGTALLGRRATTFG
jgi:pyridoxal phosphate enzyme (YggS family)